METLDYPLGMIKYRSKVTAFIAESNRIEGIHREPSQAEIEAALAFLKADATEESLSAMQAVFAPGYPLRRCVGMDVRVGSHIAPRGGPQIVVRLQEIIEHAHSVENPWQVHCEYESLHPYLDGNGRTGRMLWAWHMLQLGRDPFALPFLHRFYYQTLENVAG